MHLGAGGLPGTVGAEAARCELVTADRACDRQERRPRIAAHDGKVGLHGLSCDPTAGQRPRRVVMARQDQETAGDAIEAVKEQQLRTAPVAPGELQRQRLGRRQLAGGALPRRLRGEAWRLADGEQPAVLVDDVEGRRERRGGSERLRTGDDVDHVAGLDRAGEHPHRGAVDPKAALLDRHTHPPSRQTGERRRGTVEPLAIECCVDEVAYDPRARVSQPGPPAAAPGARSSPPGPSTAPTCHREPPRSCD